MVCSFLTDKMCGFHCVEKYARDLMCIQEINFWELNNKDVMKKKVKK